MDNNFKAIKPESEFAAAAASEEAEIYTPTVIARDDAEASAEREATTAAEETSEPEKTDAPAASVAPAPTEEKKSLDFSRIFSQPLYLAICILMTVYFAVELFANGFSLMLLLFMIAGWVTYGAAKKKETPVSGMKFTHGVLIAEYVLNYVAGGLIILCGIGLISIHFVYGYTFNDLINTLVSFAEEGGIYTIPKVGEAFEIVLSNLTSGYQGIVSTIVGMGIAEEAVHGIIYVVFSMSIALCGALSLLFNVLYTRKLCIFAKSLVENANDPCAEIQKARAVKNWLMVIGIFTAIGVLNFRHVITIALMAAIHICGSVFVKKNFVEEK